VGSVGGTKALGGANRVTVFRSRKSFLKSSLRIIIDLSIISAFAAIYSLLLGTWRNYPLGYDAYGHVSEIQFILSYFPHIQWDHQWAGGMPIAAFYFTLPFYLIAAFAKAGGFSIGFALQSMAVLSFILIGIGLYAFVWELTKERKIALAMTLLSLSCPSLWSGVTPTGMYHRVVATVTLPFFLWALARFLNKQSKGRYIVATLALGLAVQSYVLMGLIALLSLGIIIIASHLPWGKKFHFLVILGLPGVLLAAYYYLPFAYITLYTGSYASPHFIGTTIQVPPPLANFFYPSHATPIRMISLSPLVLPLVTVLSLRYITSKRRNPTTSGQLRGLGLLSLAFTLYGIAIYFGYPANWYYTNFWPADSLSYLPFFLGPYCGIILAHQLRSDKWATRTWYPLFASLVLLTLGASLLALGPDSFRYSPNTSLAGYDVIAPLLGQEVKNAQYRFGTDNAGIAAWFNYKFATPQTRDYLAQADLIPDWRYWLQEAVWKFNDNNGETEYLLDWFSVKWFVVGPPHHNFAKFLALPERYDSISFGGTEDMHGFIFRGSSPILSASNAPALLLLGSNRGYDNLLRALSHSNYNSQHAIPIRGPEFIDELTLGVLSQFEVVILYDYQYHDQKQAFTLLGDYVRNGGGLIIETNNSPHTTAFSLPDPLPVMSTKATHYGTDWNLSSVEHEIVEDIDLSSFGPAIYAGGPWGVSSVAEESIRDWASPVLRANGHPIVVAGDYGEGRVIWTGMNLLYHISSYRNVEESRFLGQMVDWVVGEREEGWPEYQAEFMHPEKRVVIVASPARGILFKESYFPNWHAYVAGQERRVYRAGPDFMYVPISQEISYPLQVILLYEKSWLEKISIGISLLTLGGLIFYALEGWVVPPLPRRFRRLLLQRPAMALKAVRDRWADEE